MFRFKNGVCWLYFGVLASLAPKTHSKVYKSIQWNPLNPIFRENVTRNVLLSSKMNFVCPNEATVMEGAEHNTPKEQLYENLWFVDKASYDSCIIKNLQKVKLVKQCKDPSSLVYQSLVFNQFSPVSDGLEYKPGKDYYFIATSDGTRGSLNNTSGGHCKKRNMRVKIHICSGDSDPLCIPTTTRPPTTIITSTTLRTSTPLNVTSSSKGNTTVSEDASQSSRQPIAVTCIPVTQTSAPPTQASSNDRKEAQSTDKKFNKTTQHKSEELSTTPRNGPDSEFVRRVGECDNLSYQLAIAFLLALVICLLILSIHLYLRFHGRSLLSFRWFKSPKKPRVKTNPSVNLKHQNSTASTRHMIRWSVASVNEVNGSYNPELASSNA